MTHPWTNDPGTRNVCFEKLVIDTKFRTVFYLLPSLFDIVLLIIIINTILRIMSIMMAMVIMMRMIMKI